MDRRLLFSILSDRSRRGSPTGFSLLPGMLVLLAIVTGSLALASLTLGDQLGASQRSGSREARTVAEAGIGEIIAGLNQPRNRGLLVAGRPMSEWSSNDAAVQDSLRSPCLRADGTRPGGDGLPDAAVRSLGDGAFRDLETGRTDTGNRQYRLVRVTWSTGEPGQPDRRANSVTSVAGSDQLSAVRGSYDRSKTNLDDPDGTGPFIPGYNKGYLSLTVEGRVRGNGGTPATATVSREFEVLPKCCGASFGSNGSGGVGATTNSLGSDSRFCGVEFGIITGINGGEHFSYEANDRFTTRDAVTGQIRNIRNILGILNPGETAFTRDNFRVAPHANTTSQFDANDPGRWAGIRDASPTAPCWTRYTWGVGDQCFGSQQDIDGLRASSIPIVPVRLTLPSTTTTLGYTWTAGGAPASRNSNRTFYNLPVGSDSNYRITIRTNNTTTPPRVECRSATTIAGDLCGSTSWTDISSGPNAWCEYSGSSPVTSGPGFHCLGPRIDLRDGARLILDTSGGPLSFYYNNPNDTRGNDISNPLIRVRMSSSSSARPRIQHVSCATISDSCNTTVDDSLYAAVGEPDRLNFFGRESGTGLQYIVLGIFPGSISGTDPARVAGAWFYFPRGFIRLNTFGCNVASSSTDQQNFWTQDENWIFSGRIWTSHYYPCGNVHIRVPPSSTANLTPTLQTTAAASFVDWSGVDWLARDVSGARNY